MAKTRFITIFGLVVLFTVLVAVFVRVLELRFSTGDIYPHYSTLRSDPLGAMAIYESFDSLDKIEVSRNFDNLMTIDSLDGDTTRGDQHPAAGARHAGSHRTSVVYSHAELGRESRK